MRRTIRVFLGCAVFLAGLAALLAGFGRVLEYKGSREKVVPFLERAEQLDVLFLGDSHAYSDIYPMELWENYGIASYNLASYNLPIPASYWVMRNALRVCRPKVIVLDVNQVWEQAKLCDSSSDVHTGLDGFPLNRTKVEAVFDLMDDPQLTDKNGRLYRDLRAEYIFPFLKYHDRWSDLSMEDLKPEYGKELGGERNIGVARPDAYELTAATADEQGFGFVYLRRILEECRDAGIRVLLTNLPYPCRNNNDEQFYTNAVAYTAEEYGVEYIDFVYLDQFVDYSTDCYDPGSHLNPSGAWKVTDLLGQHLSEAYGVPDHRGEAAYASWEDDYAVYRALKLKSLREETDPRSFLMLLSDPSFSAVVVLPEDSAVYRDDLAMQLLQNAGRRHLMMADAGEAVWSDYLMPLAHLGEPGRGPYMAVIDRAAGTVGECRGHGRVRTSFGSVALGDKPGGVRVKGRHGSFRFDARPGEDVHAAVLDSETGEVLYERSVRLKKGGRK
ncbi:MAG: SGNH/GDSL hydrolase family protein [Clostridia bacterium]|nr:SGNH/GDSL hydrolase family protein [Clostridia bacterium]